jgi:hypothetical protein
MRTRTVLAIATMTGLLTAPCAAVGQAQSPWFGIWKLDLAKSSYSSGPPPYKRATSTIEAWEDGVRVVYDMVSPRGETIHFEWTGKFDGRDYPVEGADYVLTNAYSRIDDHTCGVVVKVDGDVVSFARITISSDGKTITTVTSGTNAQGQKVSTTTVYDKQ